jgi:hypothetical protein
MHHVIEGVLEIESADALQVIESGGSARLVSQGPYRYRARDAQAVVFFSVALMPRAARG